MARQACKSSQLISTCTQRNCLQTRFTAPTLHQLKRCNTGSSAKFGIQAILQNSECSMCLSYLVHRGRISSVVKEKAHSHRLICKQAVHSQPSVIYCTSCSMELISVGGCSGGAATCSGGVGFQVLKCPYKSAHATDHQAKAPLCHPACDLAISNSHSQRTGSTCIDTGVPSTLCLQQAQHRRLARSCRSCW